MPRVSKSNYVHLLQETISVLSQIQTFLGQDNTTNRAEIAELGQAIKSIHNIIQNERRKSFREQNKRGYNQRIQEEIARQKQFIERLSQIREEGNGEI